MTEAEFLERIDGHIATANQHMARGNELIANIHTQTERNKALFDRCIAATEGLREFIGEMTLRSEHSHRAMLAELSAGRRELLGQRSVLVDLHDASQRQNEALMRVIDRLDGPRG